MMIALAGTLEAGGLAELARAGRWRKVLEIARLRAAQLPLSPQESLIAARAAAMTGRRDAELEYLERARGDPDIGPVATVMLAALIVEKKPAEAFDLVVPVLRKAPSTELRSEAARITRAAVLKGVGRGRRRRLERKLRRVPRSVRRQVTEALAEALGTRGRRKLVTLLKRSDADLPAWRAAAALRRIGVKSDFERWLVARTLFRHAAYGQAEALLDRLVRGAVRGVPAWKIRFLRGRCAFRHARWKEAASWYARALSAASRRSDRADLLVHMARALELDGDLAGAASAARTAVRTRANDGCRIALLRLELRRGRFKSAARLLRTVRSRRARDRGRILMAIAWNKRHHPAMALQLLRSVRSRPWRGPALTVAAGIALVRGDPELALTLLQPAAQAGLGPFWSDAARRVMAQLPTGLVTRWRASQAQTLARTASHRRISSMLRRWASLEPSAGVRATLASRAALQLSDDGAPAFAWRSRIAGTLWRLGLSRLAARWDPGGFPVNGATAAAWSAEQMLIFDRPSWAVRYADAAARKLGPRAPGCLLPPSVRIARDPLPLAKLVVSAAGTSGVPPSLLAALVREESRWKLKARSRVGARGLTQLMPATAVRIAASLGLKPPARDALFDPTISLRLGAAELARLLKAFHGRRAPAIAAYNAGEAQAKLWLDTCGPACSDEWYVLTIDFAATRAYTAAVLSTARRYAALYPELATTIVQAPRQGTTVPSKPPAPTATPKHQP